MRCCLSRCDGSVGAVGGSTSIIFAFEPNTNLPIFFSAFAMALDSRESLCFVMLVGVVLEVSNGVASSGIGGVARGLVCAHGDMGNGCGLCGCCVLVGGL